MNRPHDDPDVHAAHLALTRLKVEREEQADGRYVLYFSWPPDGDSSDRQGTGEEDV